MEQACTVLIILTLHSGSVQSACKALKHDRGAHANRVKRRCECVLTALWFQVLELLKFASLHSLSMYGPKGSGWPYPAYGISGSSA